jgi:hypothetical protein
LALGKPLALRRTSGGCDSFLTASLHLPANQQPFGLLKSLRFLPRG